MARDMTYSEKLRDPRWQKKRLEIFNRDNFKCCCCRSCEITLNVHHIQYLKGHEPWEYDNDNFLTLCENCHEMEGKSKKIDHISHYIKYSIFCNMPIFFLLKWMHSIAFLWVHDKAFLESIGTQVNAIRHSKEKEFEELTRYITD